MTNRRAVWLGSAGAIVFGLSWLPTGLAPLAPVGFFLMLRGLSLVESPRDAVRYGLIVGGVRYAVMSHFLLVLARFSPYAALFYPATIAFILPQAILEAWGALWLERRAGVPRSIGFGATWIVLEKLRTLSDLSLPADLVAHGFGLCPAWLSVSRWLGPFGVTAVAFAAAWLADKAWRARASRVASAWLAAAALAWSVPPALDAWLTDAAAATTGPSLRVAIVQPFAAADDKLRKERWPAMWERIESMTVSAAQGADLVVWPETARPGPLIWREGNAPRDPEVARIAARIGIPILYGCDIGRLENGRPVAIYNGAALVRPGDDRVEWYGKQRLLPFVEGIPFARALGLDPARRQGSGSRKSVIAFLGNFSPGPEQTIFEVGPARIGVLICYEGMYPAFAREYRKRGANALFLLTNDTWWGRSTFAPWHAAMLAARAVEENVPILRAANSGISSLTLPSGRTSAKGGMLETGVLNVTLPPSQNGPTAYARYGDGIVVALLVFLGVAAVRGRVAPRISSARPS